ncbi:nucleoporin Nup120/160-domain-containing protein [Auriculariales sp. MPI-PUGE-AT-0066]|nr:nucleoporin Nup120/160-domain-containing protein [Auriculariales sp. MPI-PUGE-AT-0066]
MNAATANERTWCLSPTHVSAIASPSHVRTTTVPTAQRNLPFIQPVSNQAFEHASYATRVSTQHDGDVLLRVVCNSSAIELSSLSNAALAPHRFIFPSRILPNPALVVHQGAELRVILATENGSLWTLVFSTTFESDLFHHTSSRLWFHEHRISSATKLVGPVHAHGPDNVFIGLERGALLQLALKNVETNASDNFRWSESVYAKPAQSSWLWSSVEQVPSQILSFASHPPPTASACVFAVSQDRMLTCYVGPHPVATIALPKVSDTTLHARSSPRKDTILDDEPRPLVRVVQMGDASDETGSSDDPDEQLQVLVFIATPAGESGGFFQLYYFRKSKQHFTPVNQIYCPKRTALCDLRDFAVREGNLYTLWDDQRASSLEWVAIDVMDAQGVETWYRADLHVDQDLAPETLETQLSSINLITVQTMTDAFMATLFQPGLFSPYSLQASIKQYTDALLSLPHPHPSALSTAYPTLAEHIAAVVGCTVILEHDLATGLPLREDFYHALRRDWEGFLARCRELERRARRPLCLSIGDDASVFVFERERIVIRTWEDEALQSHRSLVSGAFESNSLLDIAWKLRTVLQPSTLANIESHLHTILERSADLTYLEAITSVREQLFNNEVDEDGDTLIQFSSFGPELRMSGLLREALQTIAVFDFSVTVKGEDEEAESLLQSSQAHKLSGWHVAAIASYIRATIQVRYDMCLAVMALIFYAIDNIPVCKETEQQLVELVAAFRGIAIYRHVATRPGHDLDPTHAGLLAGSGLLRNGIEEDDVLARFDSLRMMTPALPFQAHSSSSAAAPHGSPTYSLLHQLIAQTPRLRFVLPHAAHQFLMELGLLLDAHCGLRSCAVVTVKEASFIDNLRRLGHLKVGNEIAGWLPKRPVTAYLRGRMALELGLADHAVSQLERVAGAFGNPDLWSLEDMQALRVVLPVTVDLSSEYTYLVHLAALFEDAAEQDAVIRFSRLAVEAAPQGVETSDLWFKIFRGYVALNEYEEAYMTLVATPHQTLRRESVNHLVQAMCEADSIDRLLALNFMSFADDVEAALSFKARNAEPLSRPLYAHILYAWYTHRGDLRSAAQTMYLQARKIGDLIDSEHYEDLSTKHIQALLVAINALSIVEPRNAWFTVPLVAETGRENRKRRRLAHHIPEDKFSPGSKAMELVQLEDLRWEYNLVLARLDIWRIDPAAFGTSLQVSAVDVVAAYSRKNLFANAFRTGRALDQDLAHVFVRLSQQCVRLTARDVLIAGDESWDWLLSDEVEPSPGTLAQKAWRYVELALERHDVPGKNFPYRKAVLEGVLDQDRCDCIPSWLSKFFEDNQPDYLIRTWLKYGYLLRALETSLKLVRTANSTLLTDVPRHAGVSLLPYALLDEVLAACESVEEVKSTTKPWRDELRLELKARVKRMQKWQVDINS